MHQNEHRTFRIVGWDRDPEYDSLCVIEILETDLPPDCFRQTGLLNARGNRIIRNMTSHLDGEDRFLQLLEVTQVDGHAQTHMYHA